MSTLVLQLPDSLHNKLSELAEAGDTSVEQLVTAAAGEKLAALLEGANYLRGVGKLGSREAFERVLAKAPDVEPEEYDRLPPDLEIRLREKGL